jgi:hypothetical protein
VRSIKNILIAIGLLDDILDIILAQLGIQGDGGRFDGDATILESKQSPTMELPARLDECL